MTARAYLLSDNPGSRLQSRLGQVYRQWLAFRSNPLALLGLGIVVALLLVAALAPQIAPYDPVAQHLPSRLQPMSAAHWLGTDSLGRDIFSRIVYGTRITLFIVLLVVVTVGPIGLLIGATAGYFGGWVDTVLMRITDIFLAFPRLILALAFVAALGQLGECPDRDRLHGLAALRPGARAETLVVRNSDYIAAVRLLGASPLRACSGMSCRSACPP